MGSLPVMRGAYNGSTNYYKENEVTMYNMTFRAKTGTVASPLNGTAPAQLVDGVVSLINTDKWTLTAGSVEIANQTATLAALQADVDGMKDGTLPPAVADDITSWKNITSKVEDTQTDPVFTSGGNASINSDVPAQLLSLVAATRTAGLTGIEATGFNQLRRATQIGSSQVWYFLVPYMKFGTFGTADENNGILFTNSSEQNMTPTVYWKAISAGVPTSATDGVAAGYTEAGGYRFYTTPVGHEGELGYFIVQATRSTTCAHIAWSGRYDEYIGVDVASDAGSSIALTALVNNLHSNGLMYKVGGVADDLAITATTAVWTRRNNRVLGSDLTWTNELQEDGTTYKHSATIADIKEDGVAECTDENITLIVTGTEVSYTDEQTTAITTDYIYYQLATEASGSVSGTYTFAIEDWGLVILTGVSGTVASTILYGQNLIDTLRLLATSKFDNSMRVIAEALNQLAAENAGLKTYIEQLEARVATIESSN